MKTKQLYENLKKAVGKMEEALGFENTEPMRESTIQRFEYTFELSWKLMSRILKDQGMAEVGVKNIIRAAAQLELIDNVEKWFDFAKNRNLASHIYHEDIAIKVYEVARGDFAVFVKNLLEKAEKMID